VDGDADAEHNHPANQDLDKEEFDWRHASKEGQPADAEQNSGEPSNRASLEPTDENHHLHQYQETFQTYNVEDSARDRIQ